MTPREVDRLRVTDFIGLVAGIESYLEAKKRAGDYGD